MTAIDPTPWIPIHMAAHADDRDSDLLQHLDCHGDYWALETRARDLRPGDHLWCPWWPYGGHEVVAEAVARADDGCVLVECVPVDGSVTTLERHVLHWYPGEFLPVVPDPAEVAL